MESFADAPDVLVVDDDEGICEAVCEILKESGFTAVAQIDGGRALEYLNSHPAPRAILLDLMMPVVSGWDFVQRLRASPTLKDLPIVVMTAAGPHWGYPTEHVLRKPLGYSQLIAAVQNAIKPKPLTGPSGSG